MLIFAVDDEQRALASLRNAITEAMPGAEIMGFTRSADVLDAVCEQKMRPDIVFSDIRMPGASGIELAVSIKNVSPETRIIFVTGYSDYTMDAFKVHANGYLVKPVSPEDIRVEIYHLHIKPEKSTDRLRVQCFGKFEVFWEDAPLRFERMKTKELLAYLVDQNGVECTTDEIAAVIWEDEEDLKKAKHRLRNLVNDLRAALRRIGQEDVIIKSGHKLMINRGAIDCDYYKMLDGDVDALNLYHGLYMTQFPWAQFTEGKLYFR